MKTYTIKYEHGITGHDGMQCLALAYYEGKYVTCKYAATWLAAKDGLMRLLAERDASEPPEPEWVSVGEI